MDSIFDMAGRIRIAEELMGAGTTLDENGFGTCPGKHLHTLKNGRRDFKVWLEGIPNAHCQHESCSEEVAKFKKELQSRIGKHEYELAKEKNGGAAPATDPAGGASRPQRFQEDEPIKFDSEVLKRIAGKLAAEVDREWLANRSYIEPHVLTPWDFLSMLYGKEENVLIFTHFYSQGDFAFRQGQAWSLPQSPTSEVPMRPRPLAWIPKGKKNKGVWFLNQPVDLCWYENKNHKGKWSRRSTRSVTSYRYMVLECDEKEHQREWVALLCKLPVPIVAMYSSGGKSIHALVRVEEESRLCFDRSRKAVEGLLGTLGADRKALSSVRLTRLPGCMRDDRRQDLLYIDPKATDTPIIEKMPARDIRCRVARNPESEGNKAMMDYYRMKI